jgi:hypothetical protein
MLTILYDNKALYNATLPYTVGVLGGNRGAVVHGSSLLIGINP